MKPTIGRIVWYKLHANDVMRINAQREHGFGAHRGNPVAEGDIVPLKIVRVWPDEFGPDVPGVNGQATLDGTDVLWVTSSREGGAPGQWSWPPRV